MEAADRRQLLRASEKPLRAYRFRAEESTRRAIEALIRVPGNPGFGEQRGESSGACACECSMPCMPVESQAGNQVTWNHFLFKPSLTSCSCHEIYIAPFRFPRPPDLTPPPALRYSGNYRRGAAANSSLAGFPIEFGGRAKGVGKYSAEIGVDTQILPVGEPG